ncbi:MAG: hypothetical protein M3O67_02330, partial [Bacteroidota bacterium]|nr:hypothetical protein [Bacteroidota bacterium]
MPKKFVFALLILFSSIIIHAQEQDKAKMENERLQIQKEIKDLENVYNKIKGEKNVTLGQANLIKRKIELQEKYLNNINRELKIINDNIYLSTLEINKLQKQYDTLKMQYARSVVYAYKNRSTYDYLNFIFSASNFNDALKRIAYLKSYRAYREKQVNTILETQKLIEQRKHENLVRRQQKHSTLQVQTKEIKELEDQKKEKDAVVSKLKSKEKDLAKQMAEKKKKNKQLNNAIAAIIRREIDEGEKERRRLAALEKEKEKTTTITNPTTTTTKPVKTEEKRSALELNAKDIALGKNFETSRGRLPWP